MIYETIIENGRELTVPKENPNYDPTLEYIPRDERIEWHIVGLIGQIHVCIDDTVKVGDRVTAGPAPNPRAIILCFRRDTVRARRNPIAYFDSVVNAHVYLTN